MVRCKKKRNIKTTKNEKIVEKNSSSHLARPFKFPTKSSILICASNLCAYATPKKAKIEIDSSDNSKYPGHG